ncbi:MAG: hypothetical protein ACI8WB_004828 [Phenylobacterium sp.]|jgi:hypothetical protein
MVDGVFYKLAGYVSQVFSELKIGESWQGATGLPMYLQSRYLYQEARLLGENTLLMLDINEGESENESESATVKKKHINVVAKHFNDHIIYVIENITSFNRKRLVDQRIDFIVPGKQLYLPFLAIDFRERFKNKETNTRKCLGAMAQVLLLQHIYQKNNTTIAAQALAAKMGVSKMNISRAYKELVSLQLATNHQKGQQKLLQFELLGNDIWQKALPYLTSPVKKTLWLDGDAFNNNNEFTSIKSGESALSQHGMIMPPKHRVIAMHVKQWSRMKKSIKFAEQPGPDEDSIRVELWRYDPVLLMEDGIVDSLSLFLSLPTQKDDRIDIAKEALLTEVWRKFK